MDPYVILKNELKMQKLVKWVELTPVSMTTTAEVTKLTSAGDDRRLAFSWPSNNDETAAKPVPVILRYNAVAKCGYKKSRRLI